MNAGPPHRPDDMPPELFQQRANQKRFELLVPVYGLLLVVGCLLTTGILSGQARALLQDWPRYLPYGCAIIFLGYGVLYLRYREFLDWEQTFRKTYRVTPQLWMPSNVIIFRPAATAVVWAACLIGIIASLLAR